MQTRTKVARFGYLDYVVSAIGLDAVVAQEILRLSTLDWPSYEATKMRLNGPVREAMASAAVNYRTSSAT